MKIKRAFIIDKNRFQQISGITLVIDGMTKVGLPSKDKTTVPVNQKNDQRFKVKIEIESLPDLPNQRPLERPDEEDGD